MSKVVLSNGTEFELVANAVAESTNSVGITFKPGDYTVEGLETVWVNNEVIQITDDNMLRTFEGYTKVKSVLIDHEYIDHVDDEGKDVTITVATVTVSKPYLENRVSDLESSVDDLVNAIL